MANDPKHVDLLTSVLQPVPVPDFVGTMCRWLQDAHDAATSQQLTRRSGPRGRWDNNTSFGTDRYQFLRETADSLTGELPSLEVETAFQATLLKLPKVAIYHLLMPSGPYRSLGDASDLRRALFGAGDDVGLFSKRDVLLSGRCLLFLPWNGLEEVGLTGLWAGHGVLQDDNHIDWEWCVDLRQLGASLAPEVPVWPASNAFDQAQPMLPLRPRTEAPAATE